MPKTPLVDPFAIPPKGDQTPLTSLTQVPPRETAIPRRQWEDVSSVLGPKYDPQQALADGRAEAAQQVAQAAAVRTEGRALRGTKFQPIPIGVDPLDSDGPDMGRALTVDEMRSGVSNQSDKTKFGEFLKPGLQIEIKAEITKSAEAVGNMLAANVNAAAALPEDIERDIVSYVKECFELSHKQISKRYSYWDEADQTHDLYVPASAIEVAQAATKKGRRRRARIIDQIRTPYSRAICDVRCTYNLAVFGGMPAFKLYPVRRTASNRAARIIEAELSNNMRRVGYERMLYQITLDQNRYGMSPVATYYGFYGNTPINIDPRNYFPDPRVTLQQQGDADFIGVRASASISALYRRGMYANLDRVEQNMPSYSWGCNAPLGENQRGVKPDATSTTNEGAGTQADKFGLNKAHVLNTLYAFINPQWFKLPGKFGLYRVTVADEKTVIMLDKSPWPHQQMPITNGAADWDAHKVFASSGYELIMPLQRFQDWLLRSRVENVQNIIRGRMIVDPTRVVVDDILNPNTARMIRTLPGVNPKEAMLPMDQHDTTQSFWQELDNAGQLMQRVLAANDTQQGSTTETERSATEIARLTALGQQRLGTQARMLSASQIRPMVLQMVANLQYFGISGGQVQLPRDLAAQDNGWYDWQQHDILGVFDYVLSDGTLPADPRQNTDNLMRAIRIIGETQTQQDWNLRRLFEELFVSMGFADVEDWRANAQEAKKQLQNQTAQSVANNPALAGQIAQGIDNKVVADDKLMMERQKGNVVPLSQAMAQTNREQMSPQPMRTNATV